MASADPIIDALQSLDGRLGDHRDEMKGRFGAIERKLKQLEVGSQLTVVVLTRIEERIEGGSADQGRMRFDVNQLRAKVADLEDRLGQIEAILIDE